VEEIRDFHCFSISGVLNWKIENDDDLLTFRRERTAAAALDGKVFSSFATIKD
jgi:hypothetical protein